VDHVHQGIIKANLGIDEIKLQKGDLQDLQKMLKALHSFIEVKLNV
jgi:hypothetical protein